MDAEICYLIYGSNPIYPLQFHFSLLSLLHTAQQSNLQLKIVLYTDNPKQYRDFPVETRTITPEEWLQWVEPLSYIHRSKNRVVRDFLKKSQAPAIFLDTDTYFKGSFRSVLDNISLTSSVLHACEGSLTEFFPQLAQSYQSMLPTDAQMWNSGVIGMLPSQYPILDQALVLMDQLWQAEPCLQAEQLALGVVITQTHRIKDAEAEVEHYWGYRLPFAMKQIKAFLHEVKGLNFESQIQLVSQLYPGPPPIPDALKEEAFSQQSRLGWTKLQIDGYTLLRMASQEFTVQADERAFWRQGALSWLRRDLHESVDEDKRERWRSFAQDEQVKNLLEKSFDEELKENEINEWGHFSKELETCAYATTRRLRRD